MVGLITQILSLSLLSFVIWKVLRLWISNSHFPIANIPGPQSKSWFGVLPQLFDANAWSFHDDLAKRYGRIVKIEALFKEQQLYISDPVALQHILGKDQNIYEETRGWIESVMRVTCKQIFGLRVHCSGNLLIFGRGLLSTLGEEHKKQKKMLNPAFSTTSIRQMHPTFTEICEKVCAAITLRVQGGVKEVDMLSWMSRLALELVGQCGLGYSFDDLIEDGASHPFCISSKRLTPVIQPLMIYRNYLLPRISNIATPKFRRFVLDVVPWKNAHQLRDIVDVFTETAEQVYNSKRKALDEEETVSPHSEARKDILGILMKDNLSAANEEKLCEAEIKGQIITLCFSATDTTSTALARLLHLLSDNQDAQNKLRDEVRLVRPIKELPYDTLMSLPYLDALCKETLRLYPPVPVLLRTARHDTVLPIGTPIQGLDGNAISKIPIPSGTDIMIGVMAINRDPLLWGEDSHEWKPERWLKPLPDTLTNARIPGIYANQLTFLGGARACIGLQFAQLEMKVVLAMLVDRFKFSPSTQEIMWDMNSIVSPTVRGEADPKLPLLVNLVKA
ncbi:cytochrome P450 [Crepidotus variabilis]|uniref:Cytochrome P450 n=1 Tax=Crepidotus variabilis TaxID=179855 RepID=A0A9P6EFN2_9AGAR|nr:cytochrome P450 [Crepidotus variabilis]